MIRLLFTNDDGIDALGLQTLYSIFQKESDTFECWLIAPKTNQSAKSHALSLNAPLMIEQLNERTFSIGGSPADTVYVGVHEILPVKPDFVISGINLGQNLSRDVFYSGTVGAAREGALQGIPSFALSLVLNHNSTASYNLNEQLTKAASSFKAYFTDYISSLSSIASMTNPVELYNINFPTHLSEDSQYKLSALSKYDPWQHSTLGHKNPRGQRYTWIGGSLKPKTDHDNYKKTNTYDHNFPTDIEIIGNNNISVTPLSLDQTNYNLLDKLS